MSGIRVRQFLGRSGGGGGGLVPVVEICTDVDALVTLTCTGQTPLTATATNGVATFENVPFGTWTVAVSLDGATTYDQIVVTNIFGLELPVGIRLNDLPLRSKLKIGDQKFILMAKNHTGHTSGSATLILEKIYNLQAFGSSVKYQDSSVRSFLRTTFLNLFTAEEQARFLDVTYKTKDISNNTYYELTDKFFLLSSTEVGLESDGNEGSNIGFTSNADRIAYRQDNNQAYYWWLRTPDSSSVVRGVGSDGSVDFSGPSVSYGVRPACCRSLQDIFTATPDAEGYYIIK